MSKERNILLWLVSISSLIIFLSGCASNFKYTPPTPIPEIYNSIILNESKDEVWSKIIPALEESFFVINNLDEESGLINISYNGDPEEYVDCGRIYSHIKDFAGERTYDFPASRAYKVYETYKNTILLHHLRKMNLDGRMDVIIKEIAPDKTRITVNTEYVVTKSITSIDIQGNKESFNDSISFNTGKHDMFPAGKVCICNGTLEKEVLSLLVFMD
ncbi:MAG: hypothetical protein ACYSSP_09240 [Planctomycetota bacterium]|jgi:uncharacterized protein YceK